MSPSIPTLLGQDMAVSLSGGPFVGGLVIGPLVFWGYMGVPEFWEPVCGRLLKLEIYPGTGILISAII